MVANRSIRHEVERISRLMRAERQGRSPLQARSPTAAARLADNKEFHLLPTPPEEVVYDDNATEASDDTCLEPRQLDVSSIMQAARAVQIAQSPGKVAPRSLQHEAADLSLPMHPAWESDREQLKLHREEVGELSQQVQAEAMAAATHRKAEAVAAASHAEQAMKLANDRDSLSGELSATQRERDAALEEISELQAWRQAAIASENAQSESMLLQRTEAQRELSQQYDTCMEIRAELEARSRASAARLQAAELEESAARRHSFEAEVWLRGAELEAREALAMAREMTCAEAAGLSQEAAANQALACGEAHAMAEARLLAAKLVNAENSSVLGTAGLHLLKEEQMQLEVAEAFGKQEIEAVESWKQEAFEYKELADEHGQRLQEAEETLRRRTKDAQRISEKNETRRASLQAARDLLLQGATGQDGEQVSEQQFGKTFSMPEQPATPPNLEESPKRHTLQEGEFPSFSRVSLEQKPVDRFKRASVAIGAALRSSNSKALGHFQKLSQDFRSSAGGTSLPSKTDEELPFPNAETIPGPSQVIADDEDKLYNFALNRKAFGHRDSILSSVSEMWDPDQLGLDVEQQSNENFEDQKSQSAFSSVSEEDPALRPVFYQSPKPNAASTSLPVSSSEGSKSALRLSLNAARSAIPSTSTPLRLSPLVESAMSKDDAGSAAMLFSYPSGSKPFGSTPSFAEQAGESSSLASTVLTNVAPSAKASSPLGKEESSADSPGKASRNGVADMIAEFRALNKDDPNAVASRSDEASALNSTLSQVQVAETSAPKLALPVAQRITTQLSGRSLGASIGPTGTSGSSNPMPLESFKKGGGFETSAVRWLGNKY